jgi:uncharacterized protein
MIRNAPPARLSWWALAGVLATLLAACRNPAPDEVVYRGPAPRTTPPSTTGPGASTGGGGGSSTGGAGRGGSGGSGGSGAAGDDGSDAGPEVPFSKPALLGAVADCAQARYREFRERAQALADKTRAAAENADETRAVAAREAWVAAIASWQEAELFRFGPAASVAEQPTGQGLRDEIYSWPLLSRCTIDQQIVSSAYKDQSFSASLISGRGLGAAEYLLFYGGADNGCSEFSSINAQGTWAALGTVQLARRKAEYASAAADDIAAHAGALLEAWSAGYREQLVMAGAGSVVFTTDHKALNAVSDALFYADRELKDWKVGRPLGLVDCLTATCPEAVESPFALVSTAHLRANLVGFRRLFQGCRSGFSGLGFDDWLRAVGAADLADRMVAAARDAQIAVDELDPPLERAIVVDPNKVAAVHRAFKGVTDLLKAEFVTVLNLELPKSVPSDTD